MHLDVKRWLNQLSLPQYHEIFQDYDDVEEILHLEERDIFKMGVKNSAHRSKMISSLVLLRHQAHRKGLRQNGPKSLQVYRHSTAFNDNQRLAHETKQLGQNPTSVSVFNLTQMEDLQKDPEQDKDYLRRQLELELNQDGRLLESHAWYHGPIPRNHAESLLRKDGDFLIRDSSSGQVGDLVLSCFWRGSHLHFIIKKVVIQPHTVYKSVQYQLEGDPFHSIPDLVTFYVGSSQAITAATGARITSPINRTLPLSSYCSRYSLRNSSSFAQYTTVDRRGSLVQDASPPRLPIKQRSEENRPSFSTHSLPRPINPGAQMKLVRIPSDPSMNPSKELNDEQTAPPKPSRISQMYSRPDEADGSHLNPPEYDQVHPTEDEVEKPTTPIQQNEQTDEDQVENTETKQVEQVIIDDADTKQMLVQAATFPRRNRAKKCLKRPVSDTRHSFLDQIDISFLAEVPPKTPEHEQNGPTNGKTAIFDSIEEVPTPTSLNHTEPTFEYLTSLYDLDNFQSLLLPATETEPLDMKILESVSTLFEEHSVRSFALHLLHNDLDVLGILNGLQNAHPHYQKYYEQSAGSITGIELCTLPNGHRFRSDLLDRTICLKLMVASTILKCPAPEDRASMLNQWIEIAIETQTSLGNMYGFTGLLFGLTMPQIQRLDATWHILRQRHTQTAYVFESRLKPLITKISEGTNPHATQPNCTIPDLHSSFLLWDLTMESLTSDEGLSILNLDLHLSNKGPDFGLEVLSNHLNLIRSWSVNLPLYLRNGRNVLESVEFDEVLLDFFRTEFQIKFLSGTNAGESESRNKFAAVEAILWALSQHCEPP